MHYAWITYINSSNNSYHIERHNSRVLQSPHCAASCHQHGILMCMYMILDGMWPSQNTWGIIEIGLIPGWCIAANRTTVSWEVGMSCPLGRAQAHATEWRRTYSVWRRSETWRTGRGRWCRGHMERSCWWRRSHAVSVWFVMGLGLLK